MDNALFSLAGGSSLMENGGFPVVVQNPHFASWTQLSAAAVAAAAAQPGSVTSVPAAAAAFQLSQQLSVLNPIISTSNSMLTGEDNNNRPNGVNNNNNVSIGDLSIQLKPEIKTITSSVNESTLPSLIQQQVSQSYIYLQQQQDYQLQLQQHQMNLQYQQQQQQPPIPQQQSMTLNGGFPIQSHSNFFVPTIFPSLVSKKSKRKTRLGVLKKSKSNDQNERLKNPSNQSNAILSSTIDVGLGTITTLSIGLASNLSAVNTTSSTTTSNPNNSIGLTDRMPEEILFKIDSSPIVVDSQPLQVLKPYQCDQCFKRYSGMKSLKNHKLTHSDIKPHKCSICGKAFLRADKKRLHEISHLNVKPFECATCKQRFTRSDKLKIHTRTHTGVRPYACSFCPKRFTRSDKLKIHERIHTKVKPYECGHCGKCFARSDKRRLHERTHLYGPRIRSGNGSKKSKNLTKPNSTSFSSHTDSMQTAAAVAVAAAASILTAKSINQSSSWISTTGGLDFSSVMSTNTTSISSMKGESFNNPFGCLPAYSNRFSSPNLASQTISSFLSTNQVSTPIDYYSQQHQQFCLTNSSHHPALASLAGIAQYHPAALFQTQCKQQQQEQQQQMSNNPISFYNTCNYTGGASLYPNAAAAAQVMPFFVNSVTQITTSSLSVESNSSPISTTNIYLDSKRALFQSDGSQKMKVESVISNPTSNSFIPSNTPNIAAVMAAAALGRQFQQQQQPHSYYSQFVAYPTGSNMSAFIQQNQQQQQPSKTSDLIAVDRDSEFKSQLAKSQFVSYPISMSPSDSNQQSSINSINQQQQQVVVHHQHHQQQQQQQQQQQVISLHQYQQQNSIPTFGLVPQTTRHFMSPVIGPSYVGSSNNNNNNDQQQHSSNFI